MRRLALLFVVPGLIWVGGVATVRAQAADVPDIRHIVSRLDDLYVSSSSVSRVELRVTTPRRTRSLRMKIWTRGRDRALVVIESPARERGTASLKVERNLWNYMPRISRTIRVPPAMMLSSWMGTDFTNDDVVRDASYEEDFEARVVGRSRRPSGWLVRLDAKRGVVGLWKRIDFVVSEGDLLPVQAKYYDRRMRHSRTMRFSDVREFEGRRVPSLLTLVPLDKEGHRTELRYLDIDFGASVPASTFSLSRLERNR